MAETLAQYDYRALGRMLRPRLEDDGRGWRVIAPEIGVTTSDLSRVCAGQAVAAHKAMAMCDWLHVSDRLFYAPGCFTLNALKQGEDRSAE